jgi:hypothetical protein
MKKIIFILSVLSAPLFFSQKKAASKAEPKKESTENGTKAALQLSKEELALYNGNFLKFISALKVSDRKGMEALLSEKARKMVTEVVYQKLAADIDTGKTFAITKSGYKPFIDGSSYPMIQYKYADDQSAEPAKIITAVFEKDGKILGIKPYNVTK